MHLSVVAPQIVSRSAHFRVDSGVAMDFNSGEISLNTAHCAHHNVPRKLSQRDISDLFVQMLVFKVWLNYFILLLLSLDNNPEWIGCKFNISIWFSKAHAWHYCPLIKSLRCWNSPFTGFQIRDIVAHECNASIRQYAYRTIQYSPILSDRFSEGLSQWTSGTNAQWGLWHARGIGM